MSRVLIVLSTLLVVAAALFAGDWKAQRYLLLYTTPLVFTFGLWVRYRFILETNRDSRLLLLDFLVVGLALMRAVTGLIPYSGHMLFVTYTGIVQKEQWYRIAAVVLFIITTYFKLAIWNDPLSWAVGGLMGVGFAVVQRVARGGRCWYLSD